VNVDPQARVIWDSLEFRTPALLRSIQPLSENQLNWRPPNAGNSVAWLLWHIPEVEDNWVRDKLLNLPKRYPFGVSVKAISGEERPSKTALVSYFHEVRALSKARLERTAGEEFDRMVSDEHFGSLTVRRVWGGVVTSCAWHGGQIVFIVNRLLPSAGLGSAPG
jgi:DinB superfamily